jgi:hypothetical protein
MFGRVEERFNFLVNCRNVSRVVYNFIFKQLQLYGLLPPHRPRKGVPPRPTLSQSPFHDGVQAAMARDGPDPAEEHLVADVFCLFLFLSYPEFCSRGTMYVFTGIWTSLTTYCLGEKSRYLINR